MRAIPPSAIKHWILAVLLAANLMVASMIGFFVFESQQRYTNLAMVSAQNLTQVLEQQINASIGQIDIALRSTSDIIRNSLVEKKPLGDMKLSGLLTQQHARLPEADRLYLVNEQGHITANSNFDTDNHINIAAQPFFLTLRDDLFASLVVGDLTPYHNEQRRVVPFARRINYLDGSFAGALVVLVDIDRFARSLTQVDVGPHGAVALLDAKLHTLAEYRQAPSGRADSPNSEELRKALSDETTRTGKAFVLNTPEYAKTISLRQSPDWPFHISVTLAGDDYLSPWHREVAFSVGGYLLFLLISGAIARIGYLSWLSHLRAQAEHLRLLRFNEALIRAIPIPVSFKDKDARYIGCNPAFTQTLGFSESDIEGKHINELWPQANDLASFYREKDKELIGSQQTQVFESTILDRNGNPIHAIFARNIYLDENNQIAGIIGTFMDISDRKKAEEAIEAGRVAAEQANQAKSRFLATMSHELRTPLNGMLGMAQLIKMSSKVDEESHEYARVIIHSGEMLLTLLNDILDISKIEAGRVSLEVRDFDLADLIHETQVLFSESATQKGLQLRVDYPNNLPRIFQGDSTRITQILTNLINNAIKFSANGTVQIKVSQIDQHGSKIRLLFEVLDDGIGIPSDKLDLLFQPFSQADSSTTRKFGGTGLGLSIVRSLAELMEGRVGVDSCEGKGSRFWFELQLSLPTESTVPSQC